MSTVPTATSIPSHNILNYLWSVADKNRQIPADIIPTRAEVIQACIEMQPGDALRLVNGAQERAVSTPIITVIQMPGKDRPTYLKKRGERYGAGVGRVSMEPQRSRVRTEGVEPTDGDLSVDIGQDEDAETRESMADKPKDTNYSEEEQFGRLIDYFVDKEEAFLLANDSTCSGSWPWDDQQLIDLMHTKRAERYSQVFTDLILNSTRPFFVEQRERAKTYLRYRLERAVAGVETLPKGWAETYLGKTSREQRSQARYAKYRPGITVILRRLDSVHTIAASDLSRLFRSYDLQIAFCNKVALAATGSEKIDIVGTIERLDYLKGGDTGQDLGNRVTALVLGSVAEYLLHNVLTGSIRGQLARLESGQSINCDVSWLDSETRLQNKSVRYDTRKTKGGYIFNEEGAKTALAAIEMWEKGLGAHAISTQLQNQGFKNIPRSLNTIRRWMVNPALVGDQEVYGMIWSNIIPPLLVDADGQPDRRRFEQLVRPDPNPERKNRRRYTGNLEGAESVQLGHLGAGIAIDTCGYAMVWHMSATQHRTLKTDKVKEYAGSSTYRCRCPDIHKLAVPYHVTLNANNLHSFINMMIFDDIEDTIRELSQNAELVKLNADVLEATQELNSVRVDMNRKAADLRDQALVKAMNFALQMESDDPSLFYDGVLKRLMEQDVKREEEAKKTLSDYQMRLEAYAFPAVWQKVTARLETLGDEPKEAELNSLARRLLRLEFRTNDEGGLECWMRWLLNAAKDSLVPLTVNLHSNGRRTVRLPETRDAMFTIKHGNPKKPFA